jgi:serine/threonine protein kinase/tetratricopeptide (TPR) repeat protein
MPQDLQRARELFLHAVGQLPPEQWDAYLAEACGSDGELRRQAAHLLQVHREAGSFLERPVAADAIDANAGSVERTARQILLRPAASGTIDDPSDGTGTIIAGRYKLLQQIGEGGMGTVWMGEQTEPVKRRVAVKLIRVERGHSKTILSRFEAERQAIALMDHPHIARLLDAGEAPPAHAGGAPRPFFVMELVKGVPLTDFCDAQKLGIPERLRLFMQVCAAVQHAHQKGVIHRDLKPSNVLVESHDGKPVPKIIDFGLAKATTGLQLSEHTLFTAFGTVMGTPLYMAPEQASASALDVDTRADIYALGIILYELLTGTTPITRDTMKKAALEEMLKLIREQEVPTPSSRLSSAASGPSVAANRQTEPAKLGRFVKGDLDWIVLKALAKERDRRYETANGFAKDIERFLDHEPVTAGPPTAGYRFRKFARRNRAMLAMVSVVAAALVVGTAVATWQAMRATKAEALADARLEAERRARQDADTNFQTARKAVDDYFTVVAGSSLLDSPGMEPLRKQLLETAMRYNVEFIRQRGDDPKLQADVAAAHIRVAEITYLVGGHFDQWFPHLRDGVDMITQMIADGRDTPEVQQRLARIRLSMGSAQPATTQTPDNEAVFRYLRQNARNWEKLVHDNPQSADFQDALAGISLYLAQGIFYGGEAATWSDRAIELWEKLKREHPDVQSYRMNLARAYELRGHMMARARRTQDSDEAFEKSLQLRRDLTRESPEKASHTAWLAASYRTIGEAQHFRNQPMRAEKTLRQALSLLEKLVADSPGVQTYQDELARTQLLLATVLKKLGRSQEAQAAYRHALGGFEQLVVAFPRAARYQTQLLQTAKELGQLLEASGQPQKKSEVVELVFAVFEKLTTQSANTPEDLRTTAATYHNLANLLRDSGQPNEAEKAYRKGLDVLRRRAADFPNLPETRAELALVLWQFADQLKNSQRYQDAEPLCRQALALWQKLAADVPRESYRLEIGRTLWQLASILSSTGRRDEAEKTLREALTLFKALAADYPRERYFRQETAFSYRLLCDVLAGTGRLREVEDYLQRAAEIYTNLVAEEPNSNFYRGELSLVRGVLAQHYIRLSQWDEAAAEYAKADLLAQPLRDDTFAQACLFLIRGDSEGYNRFCQGMVQRAGQTKDHFEAFVLARTCAVAQKSPVDPARAVQWANQAVASAHQAWYFHALGLAQYRAGQLDEALQSFAKANVEPWAYRDLNWFGLALVHHALGHPVRARQCFDKGVLWLKGVSPPSPEQPATILPQDWLEAQILRREAEELLKIKQSP